MPEEEVLRSLGTRSDTEAGGFKSVGYAAQAIRVVTEVPDATVARIARDPANALPARCSAGAAVVIVVDVHLAWLRQVQRLTAEVTATVLIVDHLLTIGWNEFAVGLVVRPGLLPLTRLCLLWGHARPAVLFAIAAGLTLCSTGHSPV